MTESSPHDVVDSAPAYPAKPIIVAFFLDAVIVTVFAAVGRASHGDEVFVGLWETAWTFLLALIIGWALSRAWRAPFAPVRTGIPIWIITVAGGMLLRILVDRGVEVAFIIVAASVLLVGLVGWRLIARLIRR